MSEPAIAMIDIKISRDEMLKYKTNCSFNCQTNLYKTALNNNVSLF